MAEAIDYSSIDIMQDEKINGDFDFSAFNNDKEHDGIEILVSMAKSGKINPWSIDIVDITDKYLAHMLQLKAQNLRLTGRTLLFAAILLKLKSNILENIDINEFDQDEQQLDEYDLNDDFEADYHEDYYTNNIVSIDEVLQRRTSVRLNRSRVVTLKDLIRQLEFYEMIDKKQALKNAHERAKRRVRSYAKFSAEDIVNLAHDEYIESGILTLKDNLEQIFLHEDKIELNSLTLLGMDKITAYISLLFLAVESDIELVQDEFYSDLYVVKGTKKTLTEDLVNA